MSWLSDEQGVEDGQPREGIEIIYGLVNHRISTGSRDIIIGGNKYVAGTAEREEFSVTALAERADMTIKLASSHAFVQRWFASPPQFATVTLWRQQLNSGETERYWRGIVRSVTVGEDHIALVKCQTTFGGQLQRKIPTVVVSRTCQHVLYDGMCKVNRISFRVVTQVAAFDGNRVTVADASFDVTDFAQFGELVHIRSGERYVIADQDARVLTLQRPIFGVQDGDEIHVFAGCNHDIVTCDETFNNKVNFGGLPDLPTRNVFLRGGFGIYQSEEDA